MFPQSSWQQRTFKFCGDCQRSNFRGMVTTTATWNFNPVVKVKTEHSLQVLFNLKESTPKNHEDKGQT